MQGTVNVPGVSGADLAKVEAKADSAASSAAAAVTEANGAAKTAAQAQKTADAAMKAVAEFAFAVNIPTQNGRLVYNGQTQTPVWNSYDPEAMEISGQTEGTNAGEYTVTFTLKGEYHWPDGSTDPATVTWSIQRATVAATPSQDGSLVYTGKAQSPAWLDFNETELTLGGTTSATNAGSHTATFTPKANYQWPEGGAEARNATWAIQRATISAVPTQSGTLKFSGAEQSPSWSNYDSAALTIGGTTKGTNAGSYTATFTPSPNHQWADGTTTAKNATWNIAKAAGSITLDKTTLTLTRSAKTGQITVTRPGDGAITATSSNTGVATVSVSGNIVTVTAKKDGTATITIKVAEGTNHTAPANKAVAVTADLPAIYGARWDGTSTAKWTRTDDAASFTDPVPYVKGATAYSSPFDNLQPWAGMTKSTRTVGVMVAIPKFWYKLTQSGSAITVQIATKAVSGYSVSPMHMDRGDGKGERSVAYVGRYHCGANDYKSVTGVKPKANITRSAARTAIHNLGSTIWQGDFAMRFTLWLLYIVEFADWNTQKTIGKGCGNNNNTENMGYTDSMPYHTGTTQSSRDTYGLGTQYRNIEGLWDNVYDWCDGCYNASNGLNIIKNPANFSDSSGGTTVGTPASGWPGGFTVSTAGGFPMFYPSKTGGSETTYSCDYWSFSASYPCVYVGGSYSQGGNRGLFFVYCSSTSGASDVVGSRLQELP